MVKSVYHRPCGWWNVTGADADDGLRRKGNEKEPVCLIELFSANGRARACENMAHAGSRTSTGHDERILKIAG